MRIDWKSKKIRIAAILLGATVVVGGGIYTYCWFQMPSEARQHTASDGHAHEAEYTCSMHPSVRSKTPGDCPICGMTLTKATPAKAPASASQAMEDMPGMSSEGAHEADEMPVPAGLQEVVLSPEQQVLANVKTEPVAVRDLSGTISSPGKIAYDETRLAKVTAWIDGRIERLYVDATGDRIRKGQSMGTIYSPEVVATMQEYLVALSSYRQMKDSPYSDLRQGSKDLLAASRQRLRLWGITPAQIAQLERTKSPTLNLALVSPNSGTVITKRVQEGQYVKTGDVLYEIADLSRVWAEADIFESQIKDVKVGDRVEITTPSYPGTTFVGRVSFIYPFLNPETRSVKVRAELVNPAGKLKPDMFVTATLRAAGTPSRLAVPATAVIDTGRRKIVYVEVSPGVFRPREVTLGQKTEAYYPVLSGLKAGEKVATSGGFLIDASSQIQSGGGMADMPGMDMSHEGAH